MKFLSSILFIFAYQQAHSFDQSHSKWTGLLQNHVQLNSDNTASQVDYKNFNKKGLNEYLAQISSVTKASFKDFTQLEKLSFFINAYNAFTVKLILDNYPTKSIKDLGGYMPWQTPWKKKIFKLFGGKVSLDEIEHKFVRNTKDLGFDARIHFAFNCASIGCPALLNTAWTANKINKQLDDAAKNFLKDGSRNWVDTKKKSVHLSNIFKWYYSDFTSKNFKSLKDFLKQYATSIAKNEQEIKLVRSGNFDIKYSGYNWGLNSL